MSVSGLQSHALIKAWVSDEIECKTNNVADMTLNLYATGG